MNNNPETSAIDLETITALTGSVSQYRNHINHLEKEVLALRREGVVSRGQPDEALQQRCKDLEKEVNRLSDEARSYRRTNTEVCLLESELDQAKADIKGLQELKSRVGIAERDGQCAREERDDLQNQLSQSADVAGHLRSEVDELQGRVKVLTEEIEAYRVQVAELQADAHHQTETLQNEFSEARTWEDQCEALKAECASMVQDCSDLKSKIGLANSMRDAMKNEKDKLFEEWTAEKQRFEEYISRLEGDKAALTSEREKREKNIALQLVDFSDLKIRVEHLATDCANLKEQRSKYKADLDESAKTVTRLREQMTEIGQNADRTTRERDQLRQQVIELEQLRTSLQELMEEHVKVAQERDEYQLKLAQSDDAAKLLQGGKDAAEQAAKHASEERDRALQQLRDQTQMRSDEDSAHAQKFSQLQADMSTKDEQLHAAETALAQLRQDAEALCKELAHEGVGFDISQTTGRSLQSFREEIKGVNSRTTQLRAEVRAKEAAVQDLQSQLDVANRKLNESAASHEAEVAAKLESIASMQQTIDETCRKVLNLETTLKQREQELATVRRAPRTAEKEVSVPQTVASEWAQGRIHIRMQPQVAPSPSSSASIGPSSSSRTDVPSAGQSAVVVTPAPVPRTPEGRLKVLRDLRDQSPHVNPELAVPAFPTGIEHFSKTELLGALGGNKGSIVVEIPEHERGKFTVSQKLGVTRYICANLSQNPWCPRAPGEDGYIFMGAAGGEEFIEQEAQPLFVNVVNAAKHSSKCFFAGFYEIFKAEDLTLEEWKTIPKSAKDFYCQTAKQKLESCRNRTIEEIQADYDGGSRRPPCLRLRFAGFRNPKHAGNDAVQDIYQALVEYCSRPTLIRTDAEVVVTPGKRRIKLKDGGASLKRRRTVRLNEPL